MLQKDVWQWADTMSEINYHDNNKEIYFTSNLTVYTDVCPLSSGWVLISWNNYKGNTSQASRTLYFDYICFNRYMTEKGRKDKKNSKLETWRTVLPYNKF